MIVDILKILTNNNLISHQNIRRECSGSVVECLTRDRGAAGSSLTEVTALWSLSKTYYWFNPCLTERLLMGSKESNQTKSPKHMLVVLKRTVSMRGFF